MMSKNGRVDSKNSILVKSCVNVEILGHVTCSVLEPSSEKKSLSLGFSTFSEQAIFIWSLKRNIRFDF